MQGEGKETYGSEEKIIIREVCITDWSKGKGLPFCVNERRVIWVPFRMSLFRFHILSTIYEDTHTVMQTEPSQLRAIQIIHKRNIRSRCDGLVQFSFHCYGVSGEVKDGIMDVCRIRNGKEVGLSVDQVRLIPFDAAI